MKNFFLIAFLCSEWVTSFPASSSSQCPHVSIENGRTRLRAKGRFIKFICHEGFILIGHKYSDCVKGEWDSPTPVCAGKNCPALPKPENAEVAVSYDGAVLMYFCEPDYMLIGSSEIYCNGKQWNSTAPYCREKNVPPPTSCDFEKSDLCWWEQDPYHDFDWQRHNFETPSSQIGTGPTFDHTLGRGKGGHYLYIEASGKLVNDTARIYSPLYNGSYTLNGCFSFWYHMFGLTIGSLNVYFKPENENSSKLMFSMSGDQGDEWRNAVFRLPVVETNFQIIIEGVRGHRYISDIAIDDVAILQGDQCNQTTVRNRTEDDLAEVVHAMLTCNGKCTNTLLGTPPPVDLAIDTCYCTIDCAEYSACCPDFFAFCLNDTSTDVPDVTTTSLALISTPKLVSYEVPTDRPNSIDPIDQKSSTMRLTTGINVVTTPPSSTIKHRIEPDETPECENCNEVSDASEIMHNTQPLQREDVRLGMASIFGIVVGLLAAVAITAITAFVIVHQRRSYKRGNSNSGLSEDSDVRFLTSDEALDFSIARSSSGDYDEI